MLGCYGFGLIQHSMLLLTQYYGRKHVGITSRYTHGSLIIHKHMKFPVLSSMKLFAELLFGFLVQK